MIFTNVDVLIAIEGVILYIEDNQRFSRLEAGSGSRDLAQCSEHADCWRWLKVREKRLLGHIVEPSDLGKVVLLSAGKKTAKPPTWTDVATGHTSCFISRFLTPCIRRVAGKVPAELMGAVVRGLGHGITAELHKHPRFLPRLRRIRINEQAHEHVFIYGDFDIFLPRRILYCCHRNE